MSTPVPAPAIPRPAPIAWVDVNERLPTERQRVVLWNGQEMAEGCYSRALGKAGSFGILTSATERGRSYDAIDGVLFWAPLVTANRRLIHLLGGHQ